MAEINTIEEIIEVKDCGIFKTARTKINIVETSESLILSNISRIFIKKNIAENPKITIRKFFRKDFAKYELILFIIFYNRIKNQWQKTKN